MDQATATAQSHRARTTSPFRTFLASEAAGGIVLMAAAALALVVANSPLAPAYFGALKQYLGPLSVEHWINDGLMAVFFLLVGLEIKREMLEGQLATWPQRVLPGLGALGGMAAPALVYLGVIAAFAGGDPALTRGWAIPAATDIAFALGVLALLGPRVPVSLKVFLTALAVIDDLGAVLIIALFYSHGLSLPDLLAAAALVGALVALNRRGVASLLPFLLVGAALWVFVLRSGIHATVAGVLLALTIPLRAPDGSSPLHRLEHALLRPVAFLVIPIFGFANAGVSFAAIAAGPPQVPVTLGVALGLLAGKLVGVFGAAGLAIRFGLARLPAGASWSQLLGIALLCGIGFTMSLFIGLLAFEGDEIRLGATKLGILAGSLLAGIAGYLVLRTAAPAARGQPAGAAG